MMTANRDLSFFFNPKSIAVIGASPTQGKVGYNVLKNILDSGYSGKLYPINPKAGQIKNILGIKAYKTVLDVPKNIEIAIFVIPGNIVNDVAEECGKKGIKGLIIISAGFKEVGGEGVKRELQLVQIAKQYLSLIHI